MDVIKNFKSMSINQFCSLQVFELVYLLTLAFLPFVIALREVTYAILVILTVVLVITVFKQYTKRCINPEGRVVLITGCDSGFGNAVARRLNADGYIVIAGCLDEESDGAIRLKETANCNLCVIRLDITEEESVKNCMAKVRELGGKNGLWALINNAGVNCYGNVEFSSMESYRRVMEVNLFGTLRITKACLPHIRAAKGRVITMTGANAKLSLPGQSAFCMSNFGLEALSDALRLEMQSFGVKVITIRPGNYAGATGMLNRTGLEHVQKSFNEMKEKVDPETQRAYGEEYLDNQYSQLNDLSKSAAKNLASVIDAMEDAVGNKKPGCQYLVDGGNQLMDMGNALIRLQPYLPTALHDLFIFKLYGTKRITTKNTD